MTYLAVGFFLSVLMEPFVGDRYWGLKDRLFLFFAYPVLILGMFIVFVNGFVKFKDD
jgi:hypothetical protein